ncbi:MAG: sodium:alanine symporter family protein [Lachnospiraceae bacterium]|nr:sodium:alanine symporter family protein [Lachnospiraceae bacterium]
MEYITFLNKFLWGGPILALLLSTHVIMTIRSRFVQKKVLTGIRYSAGQKGGASVLFTTLAATLGTGNIIGVSTAIALGGPGALFWCLITGFFGMATTYYECYLSTKYKTSEGGGPMYVMRDVMNKPFLGKTYAFFMLLVCMSTGCLTQSNAVSVSFGQTFGISPVICGFLVAIISGLVIVGGKESIVKACTKIVPVLCVFFILGCLFFLCKNIIYIPASIRLIINDAFSLKACSGGLAGGGFILAARYGIARGLFTNEAGMGSAGVFAGSSNLSAHTQALVSMTATFWDTVVICTVTGLVIISSFLADPSSINGYGSGEYVMAAFSSVPYIGKPFLSLAICGFAISTIIGWFYPGEQSVRFLFESKEEHILPIIKTIYIVMVFLGSVFSLEQIWELADLFNIFLIVPNVYMLLFFKSVKK